MRRLIWCEQLFDRILVEFTRIFSSIFLDSWAAINVFIPFHLLPFTNPDFMVKPYFFVTVFFVTFQDLIRR